MNLTELSRRVRIPTARLKEILPSLGFDVGMRAIKVDDRVAHAIIEKLTSPEIRKRVEQQSDRATPPDEASKDQVPPGILVLPPAITVREFAHLLNLPVTKVIIELMKQGVMAAQNQYIDFETAAIIAEDLGKKAERASANTTPAPPEEKNTIEALLGQADVSLLVPRPPVVVVMGHVDHGKTKLLDAVRHTNVTAHEHGGITQHIGAYTVTHQEKTITFIDTPGHEAFTAMRSRGARVADIAILVVAADDSVQPQTIEALTHIQGASLPFIVAVNKIDKDSADPDRVRQDLSRLNVIPDEWGGTTPFVHISAKTGVGIPDLLNLIILVADMEKEHILANPHRPAIGTIIESHIDAGEGPVATVLVQSGTLQVGEYVVIGDMPGKVRAMKDFQGHIVSRATPSMPVRILGLKSPPQVGDIIMVITDPEVYKQKLRMSKMKRPLLQRAPAPALVTTHPPSEPNALTTDLNLILRADVLGSLEAVHELLAALPPSEVKLAIVQQGLGAVTEADILTAEATRARVLGFNVMAPPQVLELAKEKGISLRTFTVIYDLVNEVRSAVDEKIAPTVKATALGTLEILKIFHRHASSAIIGCRVRSGKIMSPSSFTLVRKETALGQGMIDSLKIGEHTVKEVTAGQECGVKINYPRQPDVGDTLHTFIKETIKATVRSP